MILEICLLFLYGIFLMWLWRKIVARAEKRIGPPFFQPLFDLLKLLSKETLIPPSPRAFILFPIIAFSSSFITFLLVITSFYGHGDVFLIASFFVLAALSYFFGGIFSDSPYTYAGGSRELLLFIGYEALFIISLIPAVLLYHTPLVSNMFFSPLLIPASIAFLIAGIAKLKKSPFNIPDAGPEIAAGPYTEYSGFLLFLLKTAQIFEMLSILLLFTLIFTPFPRNLYPITMILPFFAMVLIDVYTARTTITRAIKWLWFTLNLSLLSIVMVIL